MGITTFDYGDIKDSYQAARKTADYLEDYARDLKKVTNKLSSLALGSSGNTSSCYDYMNKKVEALNKKSACYREFANETDNLLNDSDGIKETDRKVASKIKEMSSIFCKANGYSTNAVYDFFVWASTTILNKTALGRFLKKLVTAYEDWKDSVFDAIKYWYKVDGGKYVVKIVIAVAILVVAVVCCVLAWPAMVAAATALLAGTISFAVISALAAGVAAIIAVGDAIVRLTFNVAALTKHNSDPAWAKRFDSFNGMSTFLRKNRFKSGLANRISIHAANTIDVVTAVCAVIAVVDLAVSAKTFITKFRSKPSFKLPRGADSVRAEYVFGTPNNQAVSDFLKVDNLDAVEDARCMGQSIFYRAQTSAGNSIYVSTAPVKQGHFASIVENASGDVTVLSGLHGNPDGTLSRVIGAVDGHTFFLDDVKAFSGMKNVTVLDVASMSVSDIQKVISTSDTTVCAWCFSERTTNLIEAIKGLGGL